MPGLFSTHRLMKWLPGVLLPSLAAMRVDGVSIPSRISGGHRRPRRNSVKPVVPLLGVIWAGPGLACGTLDLPLFTSCLLLSLLGQMCR